MLIFKILGVSSGFIAFLASILFAVVLFCSGLDVALFYLFIVFMIACMFFRMFLWLYLNFSLKKKYFKQLKMKGEK